MLGFDVVVDINQILFGLPNVAFWFGDYAVFANFGLRCEVCPAYCLVNVDVDV